LKHNTDINIIGSIPDYHLLIKALPILVNNKVLLEKILVEDNEFNFRTEKSRKRFLSAINSAFIFEDIDFNKYNSELLGVFENDNKSQLVILFWLFSLKNTLFFELNRDVFFKYYYQGRAVLPKEDIVAFLKELLYNNKELRGKWSEITIETIASKYLTVLKKFGLLEGVQKKHFNNIRISNELLAVFIHLYKKISNRSTNVLEDDFTQFSFVAENNLLERLKKIAKKDWIKMKYSGTALSVEPVFDKNNIKDGIFRRT